ncbi:hypothetical protein CHLRE_09g387467v5 [Chlamydomonas reinhardtii]|uniref:Uncharacterized protein n=1 Tax=Chlamydomonas reinhardtii TaxID=3055 RepID=A0A2K3DDV0_CHLRE|nr:uncharacterized protein CHLRE_09g387467v5 [Chlamydomonas reinhardtii]PNW78709.1 hypothetical protein CHLRE_09g387467v5 [Chlamydomonas reinhardtii]
MIITTLYYLLSGVTFFKLLTASGEAALDIQSLVLNRVWRAPLAATFLGALLVFGFNMFSCCILIKKSINRSGPGFGYGFLVAFCFTLAFFCLLVGLIMDSFKNTVEDNLTGFTSWTKYSTELYIATEVFCFICFVMFMLFFLVLVILQGAITDHLGINTEMTNPYVPMADPAALGLTAAGAGGAVGLGATVGAGTSDGKGMEGDAQYTTQYNPNDYMTSDQYNQYYSNQYNQASDAYQTTTEFNPTSEYAYDQEQGYQAPYDAAGYSAMPAGGAAGATTPPYAAAPPPAYDNAATASAAFYGQQGAYAAPAYSTAASAREPIL